MDVNGGLVTFSVPEAHRETGDILAVRVPFELRVLGLA